MLSDTDWSAIRLTLELATVTTVLLLFIGTPVAWWLARPGFVTWRISVPIVISLPFSR
ncbi:MAG: hypothetical protein ACYCY9_09885 [Thiobacillus sp.]